MTDIPELITRLARVENSDPHLADLMDEAIKQLGSMQWVGIEDADRKALGVTRFAPSSVGRNLMLSEHFEVGKGAPRFGLRVATHWLRLPPIEEDV